MPTITTRVAGHLVTATRNGNEWESVIDGNIPPMQRVEELRSTFSSASAALVLHAAMCDVIDFEDF